MDTDQQREHNVNTIQLFLSAYSRDHVKEAIIDWARAYVSKKKQVEDMYFLQSGWTAHEGTKEDVPRGYDWQLHGKTVWIRKSDYAPPAPGSVNAVQVVGDVDQKQDLSAKPSDLHCPVCGEDVVREAICRGCKEGRAGFVFRYTCMDDSDHVFYTKYEEPVVTE